MIELETRERSSLRALIYSLLNNLSRKTEEHWWSLLAMPKFESIASTERNWDITQEKAAVVFRKKRRETEWKLLVNSHCHWRLMTKIWPAIWELHTCKHQRRVWEPSNIKSITEWVMYRKWGEKKKGDWSEDKHQQGKWLCRAMCMQLCWRKQIL